jgi:hypothetical protein
VVLEIFRFEHFHLQVLDFVGAGQRRIDAFTVNELAALGKNFHGFIVEIEIDERFTGIGVRSLLPSTTK